MKTILSYLVPSVLAAVLFAFPGVLFAQSWNVLLIPDSLKKNTRMVERENEIILELKSPGKAVQREHHVFTILNENGDNLGGYESFYGKFNSINSITGILYDANGKEVKRVKRKRYGRQSRLRR